MSPTRIAILSDVHYASTEEQARGKDYEYRELQKPLLRNLCKFYRHYIWLRNPVGQNHLLDQFLDRVGTCDHVFALGDYSCDSGFVGLSDDAALCSARQCLGKLRARFGDALHPILGDHDLGKFSMFGQRGGLRLESMRCAQQELGLEPFWRIEIGPYLCLGVTSTLIELPLFESEMLDIERAAWHDLRREHLDKIRAAFASLAADQRMLLFCHDPTALPFLWEDEVIRQRTGQIAQTFIGHLHSGLIFWKSRLLAGMPTLTFLGHSAQRMSHALNRARHWRPFRVRLCPSLAGIELLKDGGFYTAELENTPTASPRWIRHRIRR